MEEAQFVVWWDFEGRRSVMAGAEMKLNKDGAEGVMM